MLISSAKMHQICMKLEIPLPRPVSKGAAGLLDLDVGIKHIYDSFFKEQSFEPKNIEKDLEYHFRSTLSTNVRTNQKETIAPTVEDIWIFGYGSLVWKADFPFIDRRIGFIRGYQRRFFQNSIDHRGTALRPGRVVTLLATNNKDDHVYGVAYRIAAQQKRKVLRHLDYREKNGYKRCAVRFYDFPETAGARLMIIMYIATTNNDSYAGAVSDIPSIAKQIYSSAGPSGTNREYLFKLAIAMRELFPGVEDKHLFELEREVLKIIDTDEESSIEEGLKKEIAVIVANNKQQSGINVEEVVKRLEVLKNWFEKPGSREVLLSKSLHQLESERQNQFTNEATN